MSLRPSAPAPQPLLILHYHLFKNAGTSVDAMLKRNFGDRWDHAEFGPPPRGRNSNVDDVAAHLAARPDLIAFSSHTALLPLPEIGRKIFPILFIRHPIDRLKSAYSFERKQVADTFGANLAKAHDFVGYLRELLAHPRNRQARNFHTSRLACNEPRANGPEIERALRTLAALPFVGLVEDYEGSLKRLQAALEPLIPDFKSVVVHANRTQEKPEPLEAKLAAIRAQIGPALYDELAAANADDIRLFEAVKARAFDRLTAPANSK